MTFGDTATLANMARFSAVGDDLMRLVANDGEFESSATVQVSGVAPPPALPLEAVPTKAYTLSSRSGSRVVIYCESGDTLWVNLYAPSIANWSAASAELDMETDFPDGESGKVPLALPAPEVFTLALRRPFWADSGFAVAVNGEPVSAEALAAPAPEIIGRREDSLSDTTTSWFIKLERTWPSGDIVTVTLPRSSDSNRCRTIRVASLSFGGRLYSPAISDTKIRRVGPTTIAAQADV